MKNFEKKNQKNVKKRKIERKLVLLRENAGRVISAQAKRGCHYSPCFFSENAISFLYSFTIYQLFFLELLQLFRGAKLHFFHQLKVLLQFY